MADLADMISGERLALLDLLETLTPEEWAHPSLCTAWRVQDVAAHLAWAPVERLPAVVASMVRGRFRVNEVNAANAVRWADRGTDAILEQLRANAASGAKPLGVPPTAALVDAVVHGLDIRRPLDRQHDLDPEAFVATADSFTALRWPLTVSVGGSARARLRGLRLVADDADWSYGEGAEVRGPGEALVLLLAGRPVRPGELSGPGAIRLRVAH